MNTVKTAIENIEKELATLKEWEVKIDAYFAVTRTYKEIGEEINSIRDILKELKETASFISCAKFDFISAMEDIQDEIECARDSIDSAQDEIECARDSIDDAQEKAEMLNNCFIETINNVSDIIENISNMEEILNENEEIYNSIDIRDAYEQICDIMNDNDNEEAF